MSTVSKWINAGPDEGALHALLERVAERIPRQRIDGLWIFPTRMAAGAESTVIVVAAFDDDPDRRTVATAHFRVTRDKRGKASVALTLQEHGSAPVGATQRVVDGVLRRLGDEVGKEAPRQVEIGGDAEAWWTLYGEMGGERVEAGGEGGRGVEGEAEAGSGEVAGDAGTRAGTGSGSGAGTDPGEEEGAGVVEDDESETPPHGDPLDDAARAASGE